MSNGLPIGRQIGLKIGRSVGLASVSPVVTGFFHISKF